MDEAESSREIRDLALGWGSVFPPLDDDDDEDDDDDGA